LREERGRPAARPLNQLFIEEEGILQGAEDAGGDGLGAGELDEIEAKGLVARVMAHS
jgi:hypothetical protein